VDKIALKKAEITRKSALKKLDLHTSKKEVFY
jgi:hypothetical protein